MVGESGAEVNDIDTIKVNGTAQTVTSKAVDITVPTGGTSNPNMDGTASAGSATTYSKSDHVHPTDTSREAVANKDSSITTTPVSGHYPSTEAVANFVNSSIATNTAHFLGSFTLTDLGLTYPASNSQIETALDSHSWPTGTTPTNNDYVYVEIQNPETTGIDDMVKRFKFDGTSWAYEYTLNNSSFTSPEKAALESGITSEAVSSYNAHLNDTNNPHSVTAAQVGLDNVGNFKAVSTVAGQDLDSTEQSNARTNIGAGTYTKDVNGIPKTDLASAVQTSLGLADTALQPGGDGTNLTTIPTTESDYTKPVAATKLSVLFGKIWKFITSVGSAAFKDAGAANGVASLDSNGDVPVSQIPTTSSVTSGDTTHVPTADAVYDALADGTPVTQIGSTSVDLDDYNGGSKVKFYMWSAGDAANVAHKPYSNASFLVVYPQTGAEGYGRQICYDRGGQHFMTREYTGSQWTTWREVALDNGSYPNMTVGSALALDSIDQADGDTLSLLGYMNSDTSKRARKAVNFASYHDSINGTIISIGNSGGSGVTNRGVLRLASGNGYYTNVRTASAGDIRDTVIAMPVLGYDRVIPVYPATGSGVGSATQPVYVGSNGQVQPCNIRFISVSNSWTAPNVSGDAKFTLYNSSSSSVSLTAGSLSKSLLEGEYCDLIAVNGTWKKFSYSYI